MARDIERQDADVILRFGAGLHTRSTADEIQAREAADDSKNFDLDLKNSEFRRRKPFDLIATAPNGQAVKGFAQLQRQTGSLSTLVQAGDTVYEWDGDSSFTSVGTVAAGAQLRGPLHANFALDDIVLISDLNLRESVKVWDGSTLSDLTHDLGGKFFAKYITVDNERVYAANVNAGGTATPHLLAASKRSDKSVWSIADRPSSALSAEDPFFLVASDLRPINGMVRAFDTTVLSTENGALNRFTGSSAQDFALVPFFPDSGAVGEEAVAYIGNDIAYGRQGRLETLFATENFGDAETNDLTLKIADQIESVNDWVVVYNARLQKVYCFAPEQSRVYVLHKAIFDEFLRRAARRSIAQNEETPSPWSMWETDHSFGFQPSAAMSLKEPGTRLESVYMGGRNGEIFKLEGDGGQDGGTTDITAVRNSFFIQPPQGRTIIGIEGWVMYRRTFEATITIDVLYSGNSVMDQQKTVTLPAATGAPVYGGGLYYNDGNYYSTPFKGRFARQIFSVPGQSSAFQLKATVEGSNDFFIKEIGLRFTTA